MASSSYSRRDFNNSTFASEAYGLIIEGTDLVLRDPDRAEVSRVALPDAGVVTSEQFNDWITQTFIPLLKPLIGDSEAGQGDSGADGSDGSDANNWLANMTGLFKVSAASLDLTRAYLDFKDKKLMVGEAFFDSLEAGQDDIFEQIADELLDEDHEEYLSKIDWKVIKNRPLWQEEQSATRKKNIGIYGNLVLDDSSGVMLSRRLNVSDDTKNVRALNNYAPIRLIDFDTEGTADLDVPDAKINVHRATDFKHDVTMTSLRTESINDVKFNTQYLDLDSGLPDASYLSHATNHDLNSTVGYFVKSEALGDTMLNAQEGAGIKLCVMDRPLMTIHEYGIDTTLPFISVDSTVAHLKSNLALYQRVRDKGAIELVFDEDDNQPISYFSVRTGESVTATDKELFQISKDGSAYVRDTDGQFINLQQDFARALHNHDGEYAALDHTHSDFVTTTMADSQYAALDHTHFDFVTTTLADSQYAALDHTHSDFVTTTVHDRLKKEVDDLETKVDGLKVDNADDGSSSFFGGLLSGVIGGAAAGALTAGGLGITSQSGILQTGANSLYDAIENELQDAIDREDVSIEYDQLKKRPLATRVVDSKKDVGIQGDMVISPEAGIVLSRNLASNNNNIVFEGEQAEETVIDFNTTFMNIYRPLNVVADTNGDEISINGVSLDAIYAPIIHSHTLSDITDSISELSDRIVYDKKYHLFKLKPGGIFKIKDSADIDMFQVMDTGIAYFKNNLRIPDNKGMYFGQTTGYKSSIRHSNNNLIVQAQNSLFNRSENSVIYQLYNGSRFVEKMRLSNEGRLGIGTQTPTEALHVVGNIKASGFLDADGANIIPSLDGYALTSDIPSLDGYALTSDIPSLDGYALTSDIPSLDGYLTQVDWNEASHMANKPLSLQPNLIRETHGELNIESEYHMNLVFDYDGNNASHNAAFKIQTKQNTSSTTTNTDLVTVNKAGDMIVSGMVHPKYIKLPNRETSGGFSVPSQHGVLAYDANFYPNGEAGHPEFSATSNSGLAGGLMLYKSNNQWSGVIDSQNMTKLNANFHSVSIQGQDISDKYYTKTQIDDKGYLTQNQPHNHDYHYYSKSESDSKYIDKNADTVFVNNLLIKDAIKYGDSLDSLERCFLSTRNTELSRSTAPYFKLGTLNDTTAGGASIHIRGTVGGFDDTKMASIDVTVCVRSGLTTFGTVYGNPIQVELRVFHTGTSGNKGRNMEVWLKLPNFNVLNLELIASGQSCVVYHDSYHTAYPGYPYSVEIDNVLTQPHVLKLDRYGNLTVRDINSSGLIATGATPSIKASNPDFVSMSGGNIDMSQSYARTIEQGIDASGRPYIDFAGPALSIRRNGTEICNIDSNGRLSTDQVGSGGSSSNTFTGLRGRVLISRTGNDTKLFTSSSPNLLVFTNLVDVNIKTQYALNYNAGDLTTNVKIERNGSNYDYVCYHENIFNGGYIHYIRVNP